MSINGLLSVYLLTTHMFDGYIRGEEVVLGEGIVREDDLLETARSRLQRDCHGAARGQTHITSWET